MHDKFTLVLLCVYFTQLAVLFLIVNKYGGFSIDKYNHLAFISSFKNKFVIPSSAIRERNSYPPLCHYIYILMGNDSLRKYFSFLMLIACQLIFFFTFFSPRQ